MKGRLIKWTVNKIADHHKAGFKRSFRHAWLNNIENRVNFNLVSFSGKKQFLDQLYSISSFYCNIGRPKSWIIYNDGTYSNEELDFFKKIEGVTIEEASSVRKELPEQALKKFPTLLKIEILKNITPGISTIFTDSDILFYKRFADFIKTLALQNWYIIDEGFRYFDDDFLKKNKTGSNPLNLGFMVLNSKPNWKTVIDYIVAKYKDGCLSYWTDQTACHIMAQNESFSPLPKEEFVVGGNDSFSFRSAVDYDQIALRHFVGPIRHKMWQRSWVKTLCLNRKSIL